MLYQAELYPEILGMDERSQILEIIVLNFWEFCKRQIENKFWGFQIPVKTRRFIPKTIIPKLIELWLKVREFFLKFFSSKN